MTLSIAVGALPMLLDRGEFKDWFRSNEIWVEALVSGVGIYLFVVHTTTASDRSFINLDLLKSPNFMAGTVLMFSEAGSSAASWRCCRQCCSR